MSDRCFFNPSYPSEDKHRYHESQPGWFECEYCKDPRNDMPCMCIYNIGVEAYLSKDQGTTLSEHLAKMHTVEEHWRDSCRGFGSYSGSCGDCYECLSQQVAYNQNDMFFDWIKNMSEKLKVVYGQTKG